MELAITKPSVPEEPLLIRELTHRINNEFTCAASMISLAAERSTNAEVRTTLGTVMDQLLDYARVHRALQRPEQSARVDASAYLQQLCLSISRAKLDRRNISLTFVQRSLFLESQQSWLVGMIVYELINNAARHAFDGGGGEIRVELVQAGRLVQCRVSDNGRVPKDVRPGRGQKIIRDLTACLGGTFDQQFRSDGSAAILVFPASDTHERKRH